MPKLYPSPIISSSPRVLNEPFDLRYRPRYALVIDRLSWWYDLPREWLKKIALMDEVYLLNNPFTFQAMEKHAAYCAMMRLGLGVPEITSPEELRFAYEHSGERMMHVQAAVEDFDVFTRSLSIGPQTMVMRFDPAADGHHRYVLDRDFLAPELEREVALISRLVNAFFRWEFNSCETIVKDGRTYPIDYANASPDVALVSLHYYFPWAMESLVAWCLFCCATARPMRINQTTRDFFEIADRPDLSYEEKLERYGELANAYFQVPEFGEFYARALRHLDEVTVDYVESAEFDDLVVSAIAAEVER